MVYVVLQRAAFRWTRGAPASWSSSSIASRDFCSACGTPLAYRGSGSPRIEIFTGTLDRPEQATPVSQNGVESRLSWLAELPRLPAKTTIENTASAQATEFVNRQHPDHDTDDSWSPPDAP